MGFTEAIQSGFARYFDFSTRSSRSEYWYWALFVILASIAAAVADASMGNLNDIGNGLVGMVFNLVVLIPGISVTVRRLHDVGRSGWWYLIVFTIIGILLLLYWMVIKGTDGSNSYGEDPLNPTGEVGEVFE